MTRTQLVLRAARRMYHTQVPPIPGGWRPLMTEDEAWKDADENCRAEYVKLANVAVRSIAEVAQQSFFAGRGSCMCVEELHRQPDVKREGRQVSATCLTCGGGHRG